jgi:hypothetical protein
MPWNLRETVRTLPVSSQGSCRFRDCGYVGTAERTPNEVVECMMSGNSAGTASASENMRAFGVDVGAPLTLVGLAKFGTDA